MAENEPISGSGAEPGEPGPAATEPVVETGGAEGEMPPPAEAGGDGAEAAPFAAPEDVATRRNRSLAEILG